MWSWLVTCPLCGAAAAGPQGACARCRAALPRGELAEDRTEAGAEVALGPYRGVLADAVRALKFGGARRLGRTLGRYLGGAVAARGGRVAWVVPVPLHPGRRRRRGFDQAEVVAGGVAAALGADLRRPLRRVQATRRQARLGAGARARNVRGAFVCRRVPPVPILLIDDVATTGATTSACRRELLRAGAREVRVAVLARSDQTAHSGTASAVPAPSMPPTTTWG